MWIYSFKFGHVFSLDWNIYKKKWRIFVVDLQLNACKKINTERHQYLFYKFYLQFINLSFVFKNETKVLHVTETPKFDLGSILKQFLEIPLHLGKMGFKSENWVGVESYRMEKPSRKIWKRCCWSIYCLCIQSRLKPALKEKYVLQYQL